MSKIIKLNDEMKKECRKSLEKLMSEGLLADGRLSISKTFTVDQRTTIYYTAEAWAKMVTLLNIFDKEVAWHGIARRSDDDGYIISDIVVYPQTVTGATVDMDTEEYTKWIMENADDERFDNIRAQGHSHVNMAPNPSGTDLTHQREILQMLGDDDFYIFSIYNKSFACTNKVFDMQKNIVYEDADIDVRIIGSGESFGDFITSAKNMVKERGYDHGKSYKKMKKYNFDFDREDLY